MFRGDVKPETGQANFSEKISRSGPLSCAWILAVFFPGPSSFETALRASSG